MPETCFNSGFLAFLDPLQASRPLLILGLPIFRA